MTPQEHLSYLGRALADCVSAAPRAVVFGSCANGKALPGDIDILLHGAEDSPEAIGLLRAARRHYGWVDVFVLPPAGRLLVRNPWCTGWDVAKHARSIARSAAEHGIELARFKPTWKTPDSGEPSGVLEEGSEMSGPGPIRI